jgi:hypothetical protein
MADRTDRPVVWLLVAAGVVALITLGLVLRFGLVGPPELAAVDEATRPTSELAVLTYRDRDRGQCLDVVGVDGEVRELRCALDNVGPLLGWDERGILVLRYASFGERLEVIDPATGATVSSGAFDPDAFPGTRWEQFVEVGREGGTLTVRDVDRRVRWQVTVPDSYRIDATAQDPDTGTIALLDNAGRLLVIGPEADAPSVWVTDLGITYGELVWQGAPPAGD